MNALQVQKLADVAIGIAPDAYERRNEAVANARDITAVNSAFGFEQAVESMKALKAIEKDVEASRKTVKAPVLDLGRKIDALADGFLADVRTETARINGLAVAWQTAEAKRRQEEERKRQEEERRLREAEEQRLAEIRRQEDAAATAERNARTERERIEAEERRKQARAESDKAIEEFKARQAAAPVVVAAPKVAGTIVRETWDFEVLDLAAFARAYPDLVTIEVKRRDVLALLSSGTRELQHARVFQATKLGVRA